MDQAALLTILGGLYDKLVADVAERVKQAIEVSPEVDMEKLRELITPMVSEIADTSTEAWLDDNLDDKIESWTENNLDLSEAAKEAVEDTDMVEIVRSILRNELTFSVSVD